MMRMPTVIVRNHSNRDITYFRFACELRLLEIGHANHVHAPTTVELRLGLGGKLRAFHAEIGPAALADDFGLLTCLANNIRELRTDGISKCNVRNYPVAKKCIHAMACAVHKLVGNQELQRLVLFLQRTDGRHGKNSLNAKLLETVDIRPEV